MFKYTTQIASIFILCLSDFAMAADTSPSGGVEYFRNEFPKIVCLKDDYLMSCFQMKKSVCEFKIKELVDPCLEKIPRMAKAHSKHLALGACIGNLFEQKNFSVKLDTPQCAHPDKWK